MDQAVARLESEREERQAVGEALIGLARQEVVRRKPRFDADVDELRQSLEALEVAREALTGRRRIGPFSPPPDLPTTRPLGSTLADVDLAWEPRTPVRGTDGHTSVWPIVPPPRPGDDDVVHTDFTPDTTQLEKGNGHGH